MKIERIDWKEFGSMRFMCRNGTEIENFFLFVARQLSSCTTYYVQGKATSATFVWKFVGKRKADRK